MKISIFTPTHGESKYLPELWETIKNQTYQDFEWIIVKNNGGVVPFEDPRIKVCEIENPEKSIGKVKRYACSMCEGEILVEIDHDDLITPDCLEEVVKAFENPEVVFAYSEFAEFFYDHPTIKNWESNKYGEAYGWLYSDFFWEGHRLNWCHDFDPLPSCFSMIWYAPNHIRAWRSKEYWEVGGHDETLEAVDDFDLELRSYLKGKFFHIKKCLYLYRMTGNNNWIQKNQFIQRVAREKADEYFYKIVYRWSELENGKNLNLEEIAGDLNERWPLEDNSIHVLKAFDKLQLLKDPIHAISEAHRVLVPGGWLLTKTPTTDGKTAFDSPLHKSYWNERMWQHFIKRNCFQEINRKTEGDYVRFDGIALKEGCPRLPGWLGAL